MKKTLVALAALTMVSAVSAQSTVTLYGRIDAGMGTSKGTVISGAGVSTVTKTGLIMNSGQVSSTRWGMKGSEDLGGGLKANFQLESAFSSDTGATAATATGFQRVSTLGLESGFGKVELGRTYTAYDNSLSFADPTFYGNYGAAGLVYSAGIHIDGTGQSGRQSNSINYYAPAMGAFSAQVTYAPQENFTAALSQSNYWGFNAGYAEGPIKVSFGYEAVDNVAGAGVTTDAWALAASFNLGVANIGIGFEQAKQRGAAGAVGNGKDSGWSVGVNVPLGGASVLASYGREKTTGLLAASTNNSGAAALNSNTKGGGVLITYPLSKRTYVYGAIASVRTQDTALLSGSKASKQHVGMVHNF